MTELEEVILVNDQDVAIGSMEKMEAHRQGVLHRAFSVFIFNRHGELMLQQRAAHKYHSGSLWTNTCCSHPRDGESTEEAAHRRLIEEMGFDCPLKWRFHFTYKALLDQDLTEHELDHVFTGVYEGPTDLNPEEVMDLRFISPAQLQKELEEAPETFTEWFKIAVPILREMGIL